MRARVLLLVLGLAGSWAGAAAAQEGASQPVVDPASHTAETLIRAANESLCRGKIGDANKLIEAALLLAVDHEVRTEALAVRDEIRKQGDAAAEDRLESARTNLLRGKYSLAESHLLQALAVMPPDSSHRKKAESLREMVLEIRRQMTELDQIRRLVDEGVCETASTRLSELVRQAKDGRVLEEAQELWDRCHPGRWALVLSRLLDWFFELAPYLAVILASGLLLSLFYSEWVLWDQSEKSRWHLVEVADSTGWGIGNLIASQLSSWPPQKGVPITTGLLLLEAPVIPRSPEFSVVDQCFDVAKELELVTLPVGRVNVGAVARLVGIFKRLFPAGRREIRGLAYFTNGRVIARLTARYSANKAITVTACAARKAPDAAGSVAEEVTLKMLYTLAKDCDVSESEWAKELRDGLAKLRAYVCGIQSETGEKPWECLERACEIFARVQKARPESLEAHLYEGIALDLLERHEEAIEHFRHVKEKAKRKMDRGREGGEYEITYQRAAYNEAIAHLRNLYQLEGIQTCIQLIDEWTGVDPSVDRLRASPIKALALAVKAGAVACKPIHWEKKRDREVSEHGDENPTKEIELREVIERCQTEINTITTPLRTLLCELTEKEKPPWDADALRQLEWAIYDAEGNLHLNSVAALNKQAGAKARSETGAYQDLYSVSLLVKQAGVMDREGREKKLEVALKAFRKCEMLLPPGVETLSNLGTLFLFRGGPGDLAKARSYFKRVIDLNPKYEYAYYRLAQCWEMERWREKVIEVLKGFPKPPGIPSFQEMYREYYVEPKVDDALPQEGQRPSQQEQRPPEKGQESQEGQGPPQIEPVPAEAQPGQPAEP